MRPSRLFLAVLIAAALAGAAGPSFAAGPTVPAGFRVVSDASGGRILEGTLGRVNGLSGAFGATLRRANGYFGNTLQLVGAVRSRDGRTIMGLIRARLGGTAVMGLAVSGIDPKGGGLGAVLFDSSQRFPKSVGSMVTRLAQTPVAPASSAASRSGSNVAAADALKEAIAKLKLSTVRAQDGTVEARIPEGWRVVQLGRGTLMTTGPDEAETICGVTISLLDPRGSAAQQNAAYARQTGMAAPSVGLLVPYTGDIRQSYVQVQQRLAQSAHQPAPAITFSQVKTLPSMTQQGVTAYQAELVGTSVANGKSMLFDSMVMYGRPAPNGLWTMVITGIAAPPDRFSTLVPQMVAIVSSYQMNAGTRFAQVKHDVDVGNQITANGMAMVQHNIQVNNEIGRQNQARVDASMANARAVQDGIDRSTAGFVNYLRGTDYVRDTSTGSQALVSQSASSALTRFDPQHYESVPISQYVKGVNY